MCSIFSKQGYGNKLKKYCVIVTYLSLFSYVAVYNKLYSYESKTNFEGVSFEVSKIKIVNSKS